MRILILSTKNAARSILLESIFNRFGDGRIDAISGGTAPAQNLHATTLLLLTAKGFSVENLRPENAANFTAPGLAAPAAVITLSASARDSMPTWQSAPPTAHWGIENPAAYSGPNETGKAAFEVAYSVLMARAKAWLSLDFERLSAADRQHHLTRIGESSLVM